MYVVTFVSPVITSEPIEMPFGMVTRVGPRNYVLNMGSISRQKGSSLGGIAAHCKVQGYSTVSCAKTA